MDNAPVNLLTAAAHPNPYPFYADLVARAPFAYDDALQLWAAADAAAVQAVLTHPYARVRPPAEEVPASLLATPVAQVFRQLVRMRDDPARQPLKEAIAAHLGALSPALVTARGAAIARRLGDAAAHGHALAWLSDFIRRLPVGVVASLLGAPDADLPLVTGWLHDLVACLRPEADEASLAQGSEAAEQLRGYVGELLTHHAAGPRLEGGALLGDLASTLGTTGPCVAEAVVANVLGLLMQSYEATAGLLGNTLVALAAHPHVRERVGNDAAWLRAVLREVLRFDPPIQNTRRYLGHDARIAGQRLRAGDVVVVVLAAANRDPAANCDPARFDPSRAAPRCFTLGAGGHACPGGHLALAIAAAGVSHLLATGLDLEQAAAAVSYWPLVNARVPRFGDQWRSAPTGAGGRPA